MFTLPQLLDSLQVEQLDSLLFRGYSLDLPLVRVFGGQVVAQSINAASRTVPEERRPHSFHSYFLRPGDPKKPIIFDVDPIRDGGTFTTRRVVAKQNGKAIFNCTVSYQLVEEGLSHQMDMPNNLPDPETLERDVDREKRLMAKVPGRQPNMFFPGDVIDVRMTEPRDPYEPTVEEPVQGYWFRINGQLADDLSLHKVLLAYVSDYGLMAAGLRPHGVSIHDPRMQPASLDHAMWFHETFRVDEWLYYHMDSPRSSGARDFNRGSFYRQDGCLVASCAQEGLIRFRDS